MRVIMARKATRSALMMVSLSNFYCISKYKSCIISFTLTLFGGIVVFVVVSVLVSVAYFVIPEKKGDKDV
jgi:hypothetical protein